MAEELAKFEPVSARVTYLEMQGVLANLRLPERAELGRAFHGVIDRLAAQDEGLYIWLPISIPDPSGLSCLGPARISTGPSCWIGWDC